VSNESNKVIYSMISVSKNYDKKPVLRDISLSYFYGAKIGVLGLNGSGKTSLLRILAGVDQNFNGETILSEGYTVGYLEQEPLVNEDKTVRQVVEEGVQETMDFLKEFEEINAKFAEPLSDDEMDALIERQGQVQEQLDALDAWELDSRLEMAMDALPSPGSSSICRNIREPSLPSPMTVIFWTMSPAGFSSLTGGKGSPGREIIPAGWSKSRNACAVRKNPRGPVREPCSANWNGSACRPKAVTPRARPVSTPTISCFPRKSSAAKKNWKFIFRRDPAWARSSLRLKMSARPTGIACWSKV
jgi:energy-coupling factor transporter ATP-binding protein EcfA2